jgi:uncharacterized membrane protein
MQVMSLLSARQKRFVISVGLLSLADIALFGFRVILTGTNRYSFIAWNLILAWISLVWAFLLIHNLRKKRWLGGQNIILSLLWLAFLPNTWYVLSDFIHIYPNGEISQLYDVVLVSLLVFCGFILGFASLFLVHRELRRRYSETKCYLLIQAVIALSSFAIYVGRDLRWNTWDVIANPGGVILNVSDQVIDPFGHPRALNVTFLFFLLISLIYGAFWIFAKPAKPSRS